MSYNPKSPEHLRTPARRGQCLRSGSRWPGTVGHCRPEGNRFSPEPYLNTKTYFLVGFQPLEPFCRDPTKK